MRVLNAIVSTEAVLAMGMMVYSAVLGAIPVFGGITIHWPVWLLAAGLGFGVLASLNWPWIRRLKAANRFHDLTAEIGTAHHAFSEDMYPLIGEARLSGETRAKILGVFHKLEPLSVPCPPLNTDMLGVWFPVVQAMAATKKLAAARAITPPPLSADAGSAEWSFLVSQPTVTHKKASRYVRCKNRMKKLWKTLAGS